MPIAINHLSREGLRATVIAEGITVIVLTSYAVSMAVVANATQPVDNDFHLAAWVAPTLPVAVMQVGPGSASGIQLTKGIFYDVYVRISPPGDAADEPTLFCDTVKAT